MSQSIEERIKSLPDERLMEMLDADAEQFTQEALRVGLAEARFRNLLDETGLQELRNKIEKMSSLEPKPIVTTTEPVSSGTTSFLIAMGWVIGFAGVIGGLIIIANAPEEADRYSSILGSTNPLTKFQNALRVIHLAIGVGQIVGGVITGILFYVIAGTADAVRDIWQAQQANGSIRMQAQVTENRSAISPARNVG